MSGHRYTAARLSILLRIQEQANSATAMLVQRYCCNCVCTPAPLAAAAAVLPSAAAAAARTLLGLRMPPSSTSPLQSAEQTPSELWCAPSLSEFGRFEHIRKCKADETSESNKISHTKQPAPPLPVLPGWADEALVGIQCVQQGLQQQHSTARQSISRPPCQNDRSA